MLVPSRKGRRSRYEVVVIGASWGGVEALTELVAALPTDFPVPVVVVQHQHPHSRDALARILGRTTSLMVKDVEDKDVMRAGGVYLAPANYHLLLERDGCFALSLDPPVQFCRPSLDVTFASLAGILGKRCIGVVLTGANEDGADGIRRIKMAGGYAMAQDPRTAIAPTMPAAAIATGCVDQILRIGEIVPHLLHVLEEHNKS